jgi:hypothetical protein
MKSYQGGCLCGRVGFALAGPPMMSAFCHCSICRRWTGAAFSMIGFWKPEACELTAGAPLLERATSAWLTRFRCPDCGTPIYNAVRSERLTSNNFMLALLGGLDADTHPTCHIYYADRILDLDDGLPKHDRFKWAPRVG